MSDPIKGAMIVDGDLSMGCPRRYAEGFDSRLPFPVEDMEEELATMSKEIDENRAALKHLLKERASLRSVLEKTKKHRDAFKEDYILPQ